MASVYPGKNLKIPDTGLVLVHLKNFGRVKYFETFFFQKQKQEILSILHYLFDSDAVEQRLAGKGFNQWHSIHLGELDAGLL